MLKLSCGSLLFDVLLVPGTIETASRAFGGPDEAWSENEMKAIVEMRFRAELSILAFIKKDLSL
jgi:hypothetical protein